MTRSIKCILVAILILAAIAVVGYVLSVSADFGPGLADYTYKIANTCTLDRSSAHEITVACDEINQNVDAEVETIGWNNEYLIATTHPVTKRVYPDNPNNKYTEPDVSITYWRIQDLANKKAYGPMSEVEFNKKISEPKMPDIQFMTVDSAKAKGIPVSASSQ